MKYFVKVGEHELEVELFEREGATTARILPAEGSAGGSGEAFAVDVRPVQPGETYSVLLDQRSFAVACDGDGRAMSLVISGRSFEVQVEDERERAARAIGGGGGRRGGVIESAMPGVVRQVKVKPGDAIEEGRPLLVLEAMKMENEILAEVAGVVATVHVLEGQAVDRGQPLVTLE